MTSHKETTRRTDDGVRRHSQGHGSQWVESDEDDEPALYNTDDFRMKCMKVLRCSKKYCHDWTRCPFAHPGEKATRRDPMLGVYTGIACPDMRRDQRCPRGHYCPYAHNVFEYWLHPTRYRTALCRDVERCSRKICFFAHEVSEIRTNVERPYVSPQQLVAATETAALDPRVQAEFQAAREQSSTGKPGLMTGMFQGLSEPAEGEVYDATSLTLPAPWASQENQDVSNALSSLMRGAAGPGPMPRTLSAQAGPSRPRASGNFKSLPPPSTEGLSTSTSFLREGQDTRTTVRRSLSDPPSRSSQGSREPSQSLPLSQIEGLVGREPPSRNNSLNRSGGFWQQRDELGLVPPQAAHTVPVGQREDKAATMFPSHLNTMVQMPSHQSWGGQQNLMNAAAHLMDAKEMGGGLWSTPRGPLETPLYSTSSSISEQQGSLEGPLGNRLDAVYKQKLRKRQAKRSQSREVPYRFAFPQPYAPQPPIFSSNPNIYSQYSPQPPKEHGTLQDPFSNLPTIPNFWSDLPSPDMTQVYQQRQRQQHQQQQQQHPQNYLHSIQEIQMHQQQLEAIEKEEARLQLQQAIELELRKLNSGASGTAHPSPAMQPSQRESSLRSALDTSYDLPPGQPGDYQGLFANPRESAPVAHPALLQSQFGNLYTNPSRLQSGQSLPSFGREASMTGHVPALDAGLRRRESLYGVPDGKARGINDPGERESLYPPSASIQMANPHLEDLFSRMTIERAASMRSPAVSGGLQKNAD